MLLLIAMACTADEIIDTVDTSSLVEENVAEFSIRWEADRIDIEIIYGDAGVWWFGLAETTGEQPWRGEDCGAGDTLNNGQAVVWCHPISLQGGSLRYGGDRSALIIGEETAMSLESISKSPMFYFLNVIDNSCAIGGDGAAAYDALCDNPVQIAVEVPVQ